MVSTSQINYTYVIGDNDSNVIDNITSTSNVGGLVGSTQDNTTIFESFASIKVLGSSGAGGLIGFSAASMIILLPHTTIMRLLLRMIPGRGFPRSKSSLKRLRSTGGTVDGLQTFSNWNFDTIHGNPEVTAVCQILSNIYRLNLNVRALEKITLVVTALPTMFLHILIFKLANRPLNFLTIDNNSVYFFSLLKNCWLSIR